MAKSQIRRKFFLEKALGKIAHTCVRPEIGTQMGDHGEKMLQPERSEEHREHGNPGKVRDTVNQMLWGYLCRFPALSWQQIEIRINMAKGVGRESCSPIQLPEVLFKISQNKAKYLAGICIKLLSKSLIE